MQLSNERVTPRCALSPRQSKILWSRHVRPTAVAVTVAAFAGCASVPMQANGSETVAVPVQVVVHNDGMVDVAVYAYRGDQRMRIGEVASHATGILTVPMGMAEPGRVQLMLHQISGGDFVSDEVTLRSGEEHAELTVARELNQSAMFVAPGRMP